MEPVVCGSGEEQELLLEGCRQYLLLIANHAMGPDLRVKVGASDLVQETFLQAHQHLAAFRGRTLAELKAWLRRILECRLANSHRHFLETKKRAAAREVPLPARPAGSGREASELVSPSPSPSGHALRNELLQAMESALDRLPDHYRQAVVWRHQEQLAFAEIGQRLNCSTEAARKLWNRAVHQLRRELESLA